MNNSSNKTYQNSGNKHVLELVPGDGTTVLDIGCGAGSLAEKLFISGRTIDGITISENELRQAQPFLRNGYLFNLDNGLPTVIKTNSYDYVICSHVLEHIAYPEKLLTDIRRVLKKDGYLIVALPNLFHYKTRVTLLKGNFPTTEAGIWDYTHLRWYTYNSARELLSTYFELETATVTGELPLNSVFKKILPAKLSGSIYRILIRMSKGLFGYQLLYRCINRKED